MTGDPFSPHQLVGRSAELQQVCHLLRQDSDFVVTGVAGIGRRTLIQAAAKTVGARMMTIDCLRCHNGSQLLRFLADGLTELFAEPAELALIQQWSHDQPLTLDQSLAPHARLVWPTPSGKEWALLEGLLSLPQQLAERLDCQVVIVFHNLPHIRSWDRQGKWETYLREEIQRHSRVSYALIATVAEPWMVASQLPIIVLPPLTDAEMTTWVMTALAPTGLTFEPKGQALDLFLRYTQGHLKDAISLTQRLWLEYQAFGWHEPAGQIQDHHVHRSMLALVQDLNTTFEALLLLLPPTQARVLESLALDPTPSPQSQDYIKKHQLSRGGGLQGALNSLEQKGLIYGPQFNYRIALPLLDFWLKQRLR